MKKYLLLFFIATSVSVSTIYSIEEGFWHKVWRCNVHPSCYRTPFGTTITTINGTDRITDSRSVINTNFSNLNTGKFELSDWYATTSAPQIISMTGLTTTSFVTSNTWSGNNIPINKGGTNGTSFSLNSLVYYNGTSIISTSSLPLYVGAITATSTTASSFQNASSTQLGASNAFYLPTGSTQTPVSAGQIAHDTTSGQILYGSGTATKVLGNGNQYASLTYATSSAWVGTTTIPLGPARIAETWNDVQCFTNVGTLNVSFYDGTNRMNMLNASTTIGTFGFTTNNSFVSAETRYVDIGTPASSPTKIACTVSKSITSD